MAYGRGEEGRGNTILNIFLTLVGLLVISGIIFVVYSTVQSGQAEVIYDKGVTTVKPGVESGISSLSDVLLFIQDPSGFYSWEGDVIENENNQDLGVNIDRVYPLKSVYGEGESFAIAVEGTAKSLKEDGMIITFDCELEDYDGDVLVSPNEFFVSSGDFEFFSFTCQFPDSLEVEKSRESKVAKVKLKYDFTTRSNLNVHFIPEETQEELISKGINYFDLYGKGESQYFGGKIISQSTYGPLKIGPEVISSQPLVERTENLAMTVAFTKTQLGDLGKIDSFKLRVPEIVELEQDPNKCDFEYAGRDPEFLGVNLYELTAKAERDLLCDPEIDDLCRETRDDPLSCFFNVGDVPDGLFSISRFRVDMDYSFQIEESAVIVIRNIEGGDIDACLVVENLNSCNDLPGCKPFPSEQDYQQCITCGNNPSCGGYAADEYACNNDPCKIGSCFFNGESCVSSLIA